MKIFNPCKKCLVRPACTTQCNDSYEHGVFKARVTWCLNFWSILYDAFYWAITGKSKRSHIAKFLIVILVIDIVMFVAVTYKRLIM